MSRRGGASEKINPQEFADRIRALPIRGEIDHEWHIFYDETNPASLYGGTWEELPQGTFLRAAGSGGTAGNSGGSAEHLHVVGNLDDTDTAALLIINNYPAIGSRNKTTAAVGLQNGYAVNAFAQTTKFIADDFDGPSQYCVQVIGKTKSATALPPYQTAHIWRRIL